MIEEINIKRIDINYQGQIKTKEKQIEILKKEKIGRASCRERV